jgi:hypothetical protein
MSYSTRIKKEMEWINSDQFKQGQYIYMGMAKLGGRTVCIAVAYKIDYCISKARQFAAGDANISFDHINKVKAGELVPCLRFSIQ